MDPIKNNLMKTSIKKKIITEQEMKILFSSPYLEQIISTHEVFLQALKNRLKDWPMCNIGDCFTNQVALFLPYYDYITKFETSIDMLRSLLKENKEFSDLYQVSRKKTKGNVDLKGLLIQPIQRLPRYILLLQQLLKNTDTNHIDYQNLDKAKKKLEKFLSLINEEKKQKETKEAKITIHYLLDEVNIPIKDEQFFVLEDVVILKSMEKKEVKFLLFLFSHGIFFFKLIGNGDGNFVTSFIKKGISFTQPKEETLAPQQKANPKMYEKLGEKVRFHAFYPLSDCALLEQHTTDKIICLACDDNNGTTQYSFEIEQDSVGEKRTDLWIEELKKHIQKCEIKKRDSIVLK